MNNFEKCELLNSNAVLLGCNFQHRIKNLFKEILLTPLIIIGKVAYYAIIIEIQRFSVLFGF